MRKMNAEQRGKRRTIEIPAELYDERERHFRREVEASRLKDQPLDGEQPLSVGF